MESEGMERMSHQDGQIEPGRGRGKSGTDQFEDPQYWSGTIFKRTMSYLIDFCVLAAIGVALWLITALTFGLLAPITALLWAATPVAYHTLMVSGRGATVGQSALGLKVVDAETGHVPSVLQALILTLLFYVSVAFSFVPLLYVLFDDRSRFLHDILSGLRTIHAGKVSP